MQGPVHTNLFSNKNEAVLLRFHTDLRPHLSFSYRFARPHYNAVSVLKTLLYQAPESLIYKTLIFQFIQDKNQNHAPTSRGGVEYHE